jgi:hypothetical protein
MKKMFLTVITLIILGMSSANAQAVWGVRVGLSRPTVSGEGGSISGNFGAEVGPVLYYSLKNNFYINTGAMASIKTFDIGDASLSMYYIDVPLYAGIKFPVGKLSLYAQAGPFASIKISETIDSDEYTESGLKSFNAGLGVMLGANLNKFKVEFGYQRGLINVLDGGGSLNLSSLFIGVSYVF